jgi:hypothetical protein
MSLDFKLSFDPDDFGGFFRDETFRDTFTYRNSDPRRFPFPFDRDEYMYAVNLEPHVPGRKGTAFEFMLDVDEHYVAEMLDRAKVLSEDPLRCQSLAHMTLAGWDTLELIMEAKARDYPQWFGHSFTFLDESTLPYGPFEYIMRQTQGDWTLQDERDGTLWMDAGIATSQADWSVDFDVGMNFHEWHAPVPIAHEKGVFDRALKFLLKLQHGAPVRRFNWTMTVNPLLDTAPETYPNWGPMKTTLTQENLGTKQHLRVELQSLYRLPRSNAIAFDIRCYLCSFEQIVTVPKWGRRLHRVLRDIHPDIAAYKGFLRNRPAMVEWLSRYDDGAETSPGWFPDD